jgi:nitrile hydratase accessory protein
VQDAAGGESASMAEMAWRARVPDTLRRIEQGPHEPRGFGPVPRDGDGRVFHGRWEELAFGLILASVPRSNGELVFEQPWESTAFGLVLALCEEHVIAWEDFRLRLIAEIARWTASGTDEQWSYYRRWLAALENLLVDEGLLTEAELRSRAERIVAEEFTHDDHGHEA